MKKIILTLTVIMLMTTQAFADQSGKCGDNATWTLYETSGTLIISGTGNMADYGFLSNSPFYESNSIKQVIILQGITSIGNDAFCYCSGLTSINIPNSVTSIGDNAFCGCIGLTSINIPNSVTSIGSDAFYYCSGLTSINIPNSVTNIGSLAFYGCSGLTEIRVETGNTKYDSRDNCNAIIETETNALILGCNNTIIPNSVTSIGDGAFHRCYGLTSITIPNSVISIGVDAFSSCSALTSVIIGNLVTSIGREAFRYCKGLTSVTIGNSVTSIGDKAFSECSGLKSIYALPTQPPTCEDYVFYEVNKNTCTLYVPETPVTAYMRYSGKAPWNEFYNIETFNPEGSEEDALKKKLDVNDDGVINSADVVRLYNYIITGK